MPLARTPTQTKRQRDQRHDERRRTDQPWRKLYSTARWHRLRAHQLRTHPLCKRCLEATPSRITPADTVHHVRKHNGNASLFWDAGNLASSCAHCHNSTEHQAEMIGYDTSIGPDGLPTSPSHPFYR